VRVLLVSGSFPPMQCGVGDYTGQLARALAKRTDAEVAVLTSVPADTAFDPDVEILALLSDWGLRDIPTVAGIVRRRRPDIVHVQYPTAVYGRIQWLLPALTWALRTPTVQTWHEYYHRRNWPGLLNAVLPGGLVVVRPGYKEKMPAWYRMVIRGKEFRFIPNASAIPPVRLTESERAGVRTGMGVSSGRLVAYFGFPSPAKGIEILFDVADPARDRIVLLCDLDPENAYQREILRRANRPPWAGKVRITGYLPAWEVGRLLAAADAAVFPFRDGGGEWNTSIQAAMAQGTFVLTTSREKRGDDARENAFYTLPGDTAGMRQALAEHSGRKVDTPLPANDWGRIAEEHMKLYRTLRGREGTR